MIYGVNGEASALREWLRANELNFAAYELPPLPQDWTDVYDRILGAERSLASPNHRCASYDEGTAREPDELLVIRGSGAVLLTSEHATTRQRSYKDGSGRYHVDADYGVGGLGYVVREDTNAAFIVPLGRQTGDANSDVAHPLKDRMDTIMSAPQNRAHLSVHGMDFGRVATLDERRGFSVILGVGSQPSDETKDTVDKLLVIGKDYDLRIGVNQPVLQFDARTDLPKENPDGSLKTIAFAAKGPGTTRTHAQQTAEALEKTPYVSMQLEMGEALRVLPEDYKRAPNTHTQRIGAYLGYVFLRSAVELCSQLPAPQATLDYAKLS